MINIDKEKARILIPILNQINDDIVSIINQINENLEIIK